MPWCKRQNIRASLPEQEAFWKKELSEGYSGVEAFLDYPRPPVQSFVRAKESVEVDKNIWAEVRNLSSIEKIDPFIVLLAALNGILYRYTGQEDIIIGSISSDSLGKFEQKSQKLFINPVALRTSLDGNPSVETLLKRTAKTVKRVATHRDYPFESLIEKFHDGPYFNYSPFFQIMLVLCDIPHCISESPVFAEDLFEVGEHTTRCDFVMLILEREEKLIVKCEYDADLFRASTIRQLLKHFRMLLMGMAINPKTCLSKLPLLTKAEKHQLLIELNRTQLDYPEGLCIHQLFEEQVEKTPDIIALSYKDKQLTYHQLNHMANQLAHYLRLIGVGPEVPVALYLERSTEMLIGLLGVLKAGGVYIPLALAYPEDRIKSVIEDAKVSVVLTQQRLITSLSVFNITKLCIDTEWPIIAQQCSRNLASSESAATHLAYINYTSGSTGKPKGVMIAHRSLVNAYFAWEATYQLRTFQTCHLQMANFSFDVFTGDWARALCSGGKLVLCPREFLLEPQQLYTLMLKEEINCAEFVPAVMRNLIQYLENSDKSLNFMRVLVIASDSWYMEEYNRIQRLCSPKTRLINSYGLTEATIDSSYFMRTSLNLPISRFVPIGRPFPNTQLYILDHDMNPVPIGVSGELYIGGHSLAIGYLNDPRLTAEKFIPNPFNPEPNARLLKTGDLARYLPDGNIEFLGRFDHQVKIRGYRIEIGEIEGVLVQHPNVQQSIVVVREYTTRDKRLVAYIVSDHKKVPSVNELRAFLKGKLPHYMLPSIFIFLKTFPLTPTGKVDRKALPTKGEMRIEPNEVPVNPRTPVEEVLAWVWVQVLGVGPIGIYDNFFELGGHSLSAVQLISMIRRTFQVEIALRSVFEASTVFELSQVIIGQEAKPGQTIKIAEALKRIKNMSSEDMRNTLKFRRSKKDP